MKPGHIYRYFKFQKRITLNGILDEYCGYQTLAKMYLIITKKNTMVFDNDIFDVYVPENSKEDLVMYANGIFAHEPNPNFEIVALSSNVDFADIVLEKYPSYLNVIKNFTNILSR